MKRYSQNYQDKQDSQSKKLSKSEKDKILKEFKSVRKELLFEEIKKIAYKGRKNGLAR